MNRKQQNYYLTMLLVAVVCFSIGRYQLIAGTPLPLITNEVEPIMADVDGLQIAIIHENELRHKMPTEQLNSMVGPDLKGFATKHCAKYDGETIFRLLDVGDQFGDRPLSQALKKVLDRPRESLPWIVISNNGKGYEGPLPKTEAETLALIGRYYEWGN